MSLSNHFDYCFAMIQHHNWSLTEVENMIPWERDIYLMKLQEWIEEENERTREHNRKLNA